MFEQDVITLCTHCGKFHTLHNDGHCTNCRTLCRSYRTFMAVSAQCESAFALLLQQKQCGPFLALFRGELERGTNFEELSACLNEMVTQDEEACLPENIWALPKLDVIALEMSCSPHTRIFHHPHFTHRAYSKIERDALSFDAVTGLQSLHPVFPDAPPTHPAGQFYCFELALPLALLRCRNDLWYTALAEGFYMYPNDTHGVPFFDTAGNS